MDEPFSPPRMTRAERRRAEQGRYDGPAGVMSCKFCKSSKGTYESTGRFLCLTPGCKGSTLLKGG